jgi:hypothetical protein
MDRLSLGEVPYVGRTEDGAVPVAHEEILWVFETVAACLCSETFFAFLEFLQEAEVAGNFGRHGYFVSSGCY